MSINIKLTNTPTRKEVKDEDQCQAIWPKLQIQYPKPKV